MKKIHFLVLPILFVVSVVAPAAVTVADTGLPGEYPFGTSDEMENRQLQDELLIFDEAGGRPDPITASQINQMNESQQTSSCSGRLENLKSLLCEVKWLLNQAVYLIFALAFVVFLWGVFKYIQKGNDPAGQKEGANFMWYGIISLAVMFSVWGLVNFVLSTFNLQDSGPMPKNIENLIR